MSGLLAKRMKDLGMTLSVSARASNLIPSHSYLFGAWVEGGVAGGVFWLYVVGLAWSRATICCAAPTCCCRSPPISIFSLIWAVLFSPFGAGQRFVAGFQIVVVMWIIQLNGAECGLLARGRLNSGPRRSRSSVRKGQRKCFASRNAVPNQPVGAPWCAAHQPRKPAARAERACASASLPGRGDRLAVEPVTAEHTRRSPRSARPRGTG